MTAAGAILFLNPGVILPSAAPTWIGGEPVYGIRNAPPQTNGSVDRLNELCHAVGAEVVLTQLSGFGDPRAALYKLGLKAAMPIAWHTDPAIADPALSIPAWLALYGPAQGVVIDRPGSGPADAIRIDVPIGAEITASATRAAATTLHAAA